MCWNILLIFVIWRFIQGIWRFFIHSLILFQIFFIHLYRYVSRQKMLAHQPRDSRFDAGLGLVLAALSYALGLCSPVPVLNIFGLGFGTGVMALLLTANFRPLDFWQSPHTQLRLISPSLFLTLIIDARQTWSKPAAIALFEQILPSCPEVIFQIEADAASIVWRIIVPNPRLSAQTLKELVLSVYPQAYVELGSKQTAAPASASGRVLCFEQSSAFPLPLRSLQAADLLDVLAHLGELLNNLQLGEHVTLNLALNGRAWAARREGYRRVTHGRRPWLLLLSRQAALQHWQELLQDQDREYREREFLPRLLDEKLRSEMYFVSIWFDLYSLTGQHLNHLSQLVQSYLSSFSRPPYNSLRLAYVLDTQGLVLDPLTIYLAWQRGRSLYTPPSLVLNVDELSGLWHVPHAALSASRIQRMKRILPLPEIFALQNEGVNAGIALYHGQWREVYLALEDRRQHVMITGQTGTGKSTTLYHQLVGDIRRGDGVALIDPHGQLARQIMYTGIPRERENDVVWIDLADLDYPAPLNPFGQRQAGDSTQGIISLIEQLFEGSEQAVQVANYLRAALKLLSSQANLTMQDMARLFLDLDYLKNLLQDSSDPEVRVFLDQQYARLSPKQRAQIALPILNRVRVFYTNDYIRPVICHPNSLDFVQLMEQNKILLISLDVNGALVPPQERHLIGTLLMSQLQQSGMRRSSRQPFFIYVDEVQHFISTSLDVIFSEARKYGLVMTTANQYLAQLQGRSGDAMLGNVGTTITFRTGPQDSQLLATRTKPEADEHDLRNLDTHMAVVKAQVRHNMQAAFTLRTKPLPTLPTDAQSRFERIRRLSRQHYSPKTRAEVEDYLRTRYADDLRWQDFELFD